jgi:hypothetical protein
MALIDLKNCTVTFKDGAGTPEEVEAVILEGNLQWSEKQTIEYHLDRGLLASAAIRKGDQVPCEVRFQFMLDYVTVKSTDDTLTLTEIVKGTSNGTTTPTSTATDACEPYACDIVVENEPSPTTCGDKEIITFSDFRWDSLDYDVKAGTVALVGKIPAEAPTIVRSTQA